VILILNVSWEHILNSKGLEESGGHAREESKAGDRPHQKWEEPAGSQGRKPHILRVIRSHCLNRAWWLFPVILAIQEAEMRRIVVWSQPQGTSS
jgi:hypothetical protein